MKVLAIIQVRMGSTRLPGKSLEDIAGQTLIAHVIDRTLACKTVGRVLIATTRGPEDDPLEEAARAKEVGIFRGSADDVLDRFYQAATEEGCDIIVRITADDPFKDPGIVDEITQRLLQDNTLDYASNTIEPTYPEGLDVEVFRYTALARAWRDAKLPSEREHVTPYIWKNTHIFRVLSITTKPDLSHLRWTLDYREDLDFTRAIYARLYKGSIFTTAELLALLEREPELKELNKHFVRNAGYIKSVENELQIHTP